MGMGVTLLPLTCVLNLYLNRLPYCRQDQMKIPKIMHNKLCHFTCPPGLIAFMANTIVLGSQYCRDIGPIIANLLLDINLIMAKSGSGNCLPLNAGL